MRLVVKSVWTLYAKVLTVEDSEDCKVGHFYLDAV